MFDYDPQRRPMFGPDIEQPAYAPAPAPPSFGEMMALAPRGGGGGISSGAVSALAGLGTAVGGKLDARSRMKTAGKIVDSPMPQMKRPFQVGPPYETNTYT
jgi:hypothetical protein